MMKIGIFLEACGIKCSEEQAKKIEALVDHFLKKHYIPKKNIKTVGCQTVDTKEDIQPELNKNVTDQNSGGTPTENVIETEKDTDFSKCTVCGVTGFGTKNLLDLHVDLIHGVFEKGKTVSMKKFGRLTCAICSCVFPLESIYDHIKSCAQTKVDDWVQKSMKWVNPRPTCANCLEIIPYTKIGGKTKGSLIEHLAVCKNKPKPITVHEPKKTLTIKKVVEVPKAEELIVESTVEHSYCSESTEATEPLLSPENAAEAIANATIKMESETVQKIYTIEKPEVKTFDILEQAVSTIPIEDSNIDNSLPQNLYPTRIPEKAKTISKLQQGYPKYPVNECTGNILCPECDLRFDSITVKNVHYQMVHKEKNSWHTGGKISWKCPVCTREVNKNVLNHVQACELKLAELTKGCPVCGKDSWSKLYDKKPNIYKAFLNHIKLHNSDVPRKPKKKYPNYKKKKKEKSSEEFLCEHCNLIFNTIYKLNAHKHNVHNIAKPYPCEICDTRFCLKKSLKHHMETMHPDPNRPPEVVKCDECGKVLVSKKQLSVHKHRHREADKEYNCEICGKVGKRGIFGYRLHKKLAHGKKDKPCQYCQRCFNTDNQVVRHIEAVHIKPVLCNVCPKRFATKALLDCHVNSQHLGLKPFVCSLCNESFSKEANLKSHGIVSHSSENKPFQCSKCSKTFKSTAQLEHHFARFHELRNVETCPHCGKLYSRLKAHLENCNSKFGGVGLRPRIECGGCDKSFLTKQALNKHLTKGQCGNFGRPATQFVVKPTRYR